MVIRLYSGGLEGVDAFPVEVEVDYVRQGLPGFSLVGLAETEVREARDRVFAALRACNFRLPPARITVNLAPAGQRKAGTGYDLPLAVGLLAAAGLIPPDKLSGLFFTGELSLTGSLKPVKPPWCPVCRCMPHATWPSARPFWREPRPWKPGGRTKPSRRPSPCRTSRRSKASRPPNVGWRWLPQGDTIS